MGNKIQSISIRRCFIHIYIAVAILIQTILYCVFTKPGNKREILSAAGMGLLKLFYKSLKEREYANSHIESLGKWCIKS